MVHEPLIRSCYFWGGYVKGGVGRWSSFSSGWFCRGVYGGFRKWWYPTTMGFPTKNDHFGVFCRYHHLRKHTYTKHLFFFELREKKHDAGVWKTSTYPLVYILHLWEKVVLKSFRCSWLLGFSCYMGVTKNSGTPKWMVYNGKPY